MNTYDGPSLWVLLILIALLFVVLWGFLVLVLAFGTWFIARSKIMDDDRPRQSGGDWDVPLPRDIFPPDRR
jgi:hypothetical protein